VEDRPFNGITVAVLGTLKCATTTSTKTLPQNITLVYHKSFAVIRSCSSHTLLAKYPINELVREMAG